jgi:hypothetical protein
LLGRLCTSFDCTKNLCNWQISCWLLMFLLKLLRTPQSICFSFHVPLSRGAT